MLNCDLIRADPEKRKGNRYLYRCSRKGCGYEVYADYPPPVNKCKSLVTSFPSIEDVNNLVTACITSYKRPESLDRLVKSIKRYYPDLKIEIQETGGNLSWGRNRLVEKCETPLFLLLEDDFEFTEETDLRKFVDILMVDIHAGGVGGAIIENGVVDCWKLMFDSFRRELSTEETKNPVRKTASGTEYQRCNLVWNFALFRIQTLWSCKWNEKLPVCEHVEFFYRLWRKKEWRVSVTEDVKIIHHKDELSRPSKEYEKDRKRHFLLQVANKEMGHTLIPVRGNGRLHMLHPGKTGGSAVKSALSDNEHDGTTLHFRKGKWIITLHRHKKTLMEIPDGEKVFFFLRHPVERFISAFNARKREDKPRYHYPWWEGERKAFAKFATANDLAEALPHDEDAKQAMLDIAHIRDHYTKWFDSIEYFNTREADILFVGFQETLNKDFLRLSKILGVRAKLPVDVLANRAPEGEDTSMSEVGRANLELHYAKDIEFYEELKRRYMEVPHGKL